ncbi:MAG: hypothetical protein HY011_26640 [Acidobacteria bacterium]|nr:hypothetical protein [Acidobacteriota bacterium]
MPCRLIANLLFCERRALGALGLFAALGLPAAAQNELDHWTTADGLPQNAINAITQTRDGYLWLATNDGLVRFDGLRFTVFKRSTTPGLATNRFRCLYEDSQGTLWAGSPESILTRYRDGQFHSYTVKDGLPTDEIGKIDEDETGLLWLTGAQFGYVVAWRDGPVNVFRARDRLPGLYQVKNAGGNMLWSLSAAGLHLLRHGLVLTLTPRDGLPDLTINAVMADAQDSVWINARGGSVRLRGGQLSVIAPPSAQLSQALGLCHFADRYGNYWYPVPGQLVRVDAQSRTVYDKLTVTAFWEDRESALWIGANEGLYCYRQRPVRILTEAPGPRYNVTRLIYSVLEDRQGDVWLGKWGSGLSRYHAGQFTHYVAGPVWFRAITLARQQGDRIFDNYVYTAGLYEAKVTALYEDRAGLLWAGTNGGTASGVSQFKDGQWTRFSSEHGLADTWAILQDRAGAYWFATSTGLTRLRDGQWTVFTTQDGLPGNECHALLEDHQGRLWIGTYNGLARWDGQRFRAWTENEGLAGRQVRCLYEDAAGALWIGTYDGGLTRLKDGRLTPFTSRQGLFNDGVSWLLDDGQGCFWLSCNRGIFRVSQRELNELAEGRRHSISSLAYGKQDGMRDAECNGGRQPAGWRLRNGQLWFPTMEGVAIIDPANVPRNTQPPTALIEESLLDQQALPWRDGVRLLPGQTNLELRYTGTSLLHSEAVTFQYQLSGVDQTWVEAGTRRSANYSHLPPGQYSFSLRAANSDGVWGAPGPPLRIVVLPHWWQTWWFRGLAGLSVAGLIALVARTRRRRAQQQQATQAAFARRLIDTQEHERERFASEIHNDLNQYLLVIKSRATLGAQAAADPEAVRVQFDEIETWAKQGLEEARRIAYDLRPHQLDDLGLAATLEALLAKLSTATPIKFTGDLADVRGLLTPAAETSLFRIAQECANNIIKHSHATAAHFELSCDARAVRLTVTDNGQGFAPETIQPACSFGLTDIAERVRLLGGTLQLEAAPGQGVILKITLPCQPQTKRSESDEPHE